MKIKNVLLFVILFIAPFLVMAQTGEVVDFSSPASIVAYLMPAIVWLATTLVKTFSSSIKGNVAMIVVFAISALITFLTTFLEGENVSWIMQLLAGLASSFLYSAQKQIKSE